MTSLNRLVCGGMAGITSVVCTYPLDIVRTRLSIQSASFSELRTTKPKKLPGMWETMVVMYKTEGGVPALYRGIVPTVAGVAPYVSVHPMRLDRGGCLDMLTNLAGWSQLHDLRAGAEALDARRRKEPKCGAETARWCGRWSCSSDIHISIVSSGV